MNKPTRAYFWKDTSDDSIVVGCYECSDLRAVFLEIESARDWAQGHQRQTHRASQKVGFKELTKN